MIYFGWDGWGPWHSWAGTIWFCAGCFFTYFFSICWQALDDRQEAKAWWPIFLFLVLLVSTSAATAGYYAWFAGATAQLGTCNEYLHQIQKGYEYKLKNLEN